MSSQLNCRSNTILNHRVTCESITELNKSHLTCTLSNTQISQQYYVTYLCFKSRQLCVTCLIHVKLYRNTIDKNRRNEVLGYL